MTVYAYQRYEYTDNDVIRRCYASRAVGATGKHSEEAAVAQELDLYGTSINWKKTISIFTVASVIVGALGFFGYRWLTTTTPVSKDQALELFEKESAAAETGASSNETSENNDARGKGPDKARSTKTDDQASGSGGGGSSPKEETRTVAAGSGKTTSSDPSERSRSGYRYPTTPANGVYSWDTDGWEEAQGIRREFPEESQRIITQSNGSSWNQHHYFSEEREIWSEFVITKKGAHVAMQRNRAKFGPVTNDSRIDFSPPMLVGLPDPEVGASWNGSWKDQTSGTYTSRIYDHGRMTIGGENIEVWSYEVRMQMRGEMNGTVYAKVVFAPKYALTVQEHYEQNIESGRTHYRAEWTMTLQSTTPQR